MPITFPCPYSNCSRTFSNVNEQRAGNIADCPVCNKSVTVPTQQILSWFQSQKIKIGEKGEHDETLMHQAAHADRADVIVWLSKHKGISVEDKDKDGYTPLHVAVEQSKSASIICLVKELKADVNARDSSDTTPLFVAAFEGQVVGMDYLFNLCKELKLELKLVLESRNGITLEQFVDACQPAKSKRMVA